MEKLSLGGVTHIKCDITSPKSFTIDSMDMNSINIIVGQNDSGKSFLNKMIYFASLTAYMNLTGALKEVKADSNKDKIQYLFNGIFVNPEELSGYIIAKFEHGTFECHFKDGEIGTGLVNYDSGVVDASYPKYMSTSTRLFSQIESILAMENYMSESDILKKYRLFDLLHCHAMKEFALKTKVIGDTLSKLLKESYDVDVKEIGYDETELTFNYTTSTGKVRPVSSLGAGHQSLLNMMISSYH